MGTFISCEVLFQWESKDSKAIGEQVGYIVDAHSSEKKFIIIVKCNSDVYLIS